MLINLTELFPVEGKTKHYECELELTSCHGARGEYPVKEKHPVVLDIKNQGKKVFGVTGNAELTLEMPCDRCLEPVDVPFQLEIDVEIDMKLTGEERQQALDEQPYVDGYNLDVDQLVRNELSLNMPMKVLCSESCKGICSACGTNLNRGTCDCDTRSLDPRMSVIQDIFKQLKEV